MVKNVFETNKRDLDDGVASVRIHSMVWMASL